LVEQFHRRLKDAFRSRAAAANWHDHLPWVLLGIRTAFREDSEFSQRQRRCTVRSWFYLDSSSTPPSRCRHPSSRSCKPR
jgi:hypothetical protein